MDLMEFGKTFLAICGAITIIGGASRVIYGWVKPAIRLKSRVKTLEETVDPELGKKVAKLEENVQKDYKSIQEIKDMQSLLCQGMIAMIDNRITGKNIDGLKKTKEAMIKHLSEGI